VYTLPLLVISVYFIDYLFALYVIIIAKKPILDKYYKGITFLQSNTKGLISALSN
jgi:hypothetical protein